MSLVADITKLQERKDSLLREVDLINKELDQVAVMLGTKKSVSAVAHHPGLGPKSRRATRGDNYRLVTHWLRMQAGAKTVREICEGTLIGTSSVHNVLSNHRREFIHRGVRWGLSESQFADHSADLEEQSHGNASVTDSSLLIAPSMTGAMDTSNALTTTANTAPADTASAKDAAYAMKPTVPSLGKAS